MRELVETSKVENALQEDEIKELILVDVGVKLIDPFISKSRLPVLLKMLEQEVIARWDHTAVTDANTEKGRKTLISRARTIASVSARLDEIGKQEVAKLKDLPKQVDAGRRQAREYFEKWKEAVRQPVAQWEEKQKAVMALAQVILDHEQALIDNEIWKADKEQERLTIEREKKELEEKLRAEIKEEVKQEVSKELCSLSLQTDDATINISSNVDLTLIKDNTTLTVEQHETQTNRKGLRETCLFIMDTIDVDYSKALKLIHAIEEGKAPYLKRVYEV
jgi:hypothetical protein